MGAVEAGVVLQAFAPAGRGRSGCSQCSGPSTLSCRTTSWCSPHRGAFHELGVVTTVVSRSSRRRSSPSPWCVRPIGRAPVDSRSGVVAILRSIVPVLERGLERAVSLSESMDACGFGFEGSTRGDQVAGWCGLGALLAPRGIVRCARRPGPARRRRPGGRRGRVPRRGDGVRVGADP